MSREIDQKITMEIPMKIQLHGNEKNPKRVYLLLHGFSLTGKFMLDFFKSIAHEDDLIISPNAPFPSPVRSKGEFLEGYSWFFYDVKKDQFFIEYDTAAKAVVDGVEKYIPKNSEVIIVGYSQGGYLSPFVANKLAQTKAIICVASSSRVELLENKLNFEIYTINGSLDTIVDFEKAIKRMEELVSRGTKGQSYIIENNHRLDPEYLRTVKNILKEHLS